MTANCVSWTAAAASSPTNWTRRNIDESIGESVQSSSYLKSPYYTPLGFPDGMYRVGPLARLNVCERMGVPKADAELKNFKKLGRGAVTSSFLYHYARLIEILAALEFIERYMDDPDLLSEDLRADAGINSLRGVGVERGAARHAVPRLHRGPQRPAAKGQPDRRHRPEQSGHEPDRGPNRAALRARRRSFPKPMLNRVEHGIRCYDPCLSCSTHAVGQMPLHVQSDRPRRRPLERSRARLMSMLSMPSTGVPAPKTPPVQRDAFLIIGYGNTLRGDDAAGPRVAEAVAALNLSRRARPPLPFLTPELADPISQAGRGPLRGRRRGRPAQSPSPQTPAPPRPRRSWPTPPVPRPCSPWPATSSAARPRPGG